MAINKVGSKGIEDGSVASADFAPNTVTSAKLEDGAVTNAKLTNTSVTLAGSSVSLGGSVSFNNKFVDWQSVITADGSTGTTAVSGQGYFIDTTSAAHTLTLPASATIGDFIAIKDYAGTFNTNNLTIARNGHNIQGVANDSLISTNRASLVLVYVDSTKGWLYWEEHNVADLQRLVAATGGTVATSGDYKIHTFTGDGCFVVTTAGYLDYLVVGGGGGGGSAGTHAGCNGAGGGGGGAGGYRTTYPSCDTGLLITSGTYPITVGGGGATGPLTPNARQGSSGSNSVFSTITSTGGGGGGEGGQTGQPAQPSMFGLPGGSGGGGGAQPFPVGSPYPGGTGNTPPVSPPQGNNGGSPNTGNPSYGLSGGGGGGAGAVGASATSSTGPSQPAGLNNSITGSSVGYAGGGGGGSGGNKTGGGGTVPNPFGAGKGGAAEPFIPGCGASVATSGIANRGSGGGGAGHGNCSSGSNSGGAGGKGIVIIRYKFQ